MGTTPLFGIPFADPGDQVKDGAAAMQLQAEAIEAALTPAVVHSPWHDPDQALAASVNTALVFGPLGSATTPGRFALESGGTVLRYTGPTRWFDILVQLRVAITVAAAANGWATDATLFHNGVGFVASHFAFLNHNADTFDGALMHRLHGPVPLASGDTLTVTVSSTEDGGITGRDLLGVSTTPAQA